jgi:hypothetical protein
MKSPADERLLALLQQTVRTALRPWLDDNKAEFLHVLGEAMLHNERIKREQQHTNFGEFLSVAALAQRWQLNPETVRRMIRDGRIPSMLAGRHHRVALVTVVGFEKDGSLPRR